MAKFETAIVRVRGIEPIEGADKIELAVIGDYRSVVQKGSVTVGQPVAYICEGSIVPDHILEHLNLVGRLAGSKKNRVKPVVFKGMLSQGLVLPCVEAEPNGVIYLNDGQAIHLPIVIGEDVSSLIGVTKWEPEIPTHLAGQIYNSGTDVTILFDVENYKKFPDSLVDGETVYMTEKLHGTCCGVGFIDPTIERHPDAFDVKGTQVTVFSKGNGGKGLCFKSNEANANVVYIKSTVADDRMSTAMSEANKHVRLMMDPAKRRLMFGPKVEIDGAMSVFFVGEVYGGSVQSGFSYGTTPSFRLFAIAVKIDGRVRFIDTVDVFAIAHGYGLATVPVLYVGPYSKEIMIQHTSGLETVSGKHMHMREGVIVTPERERYEGNLGRVILKSVSPEYLARKNGTEYQ